MIEDLIKRIDFLQRDLSRLQDNLEELRVQINNEQNKSQKKEDKILAL